MSGIEILGIAASVIQIADAGARLSTKLFVFTRRVKGADRTISDLSQEIAATGAALRELGEALEQDKYSKLGSRQSVETTSQIVADCWKIFGDINDTVGGAKLCKTTDEGTAGDALAKFKPPSFNLKQRLKFPFIENQIVLLKSKLESLKTSLILMLQVLLLAEQVRNRPQIAVTQEQTALIQSLIDERDEKEMRFRSSCKLLQDESADPPTLERALTDDSTIVSEAPLGEKASQRFGVDPSLAPFIVAKSQPDGLAPPAQPRKQSFIGPAIPKVDLKAKQPGKTSTHATASLQTTTGAPVQNKSLVLPTALRYRQQEIVHHARLVQNLLDEISDVQYQIDHKIRHGMQDGVLKTHFDQWRPYFSKHGPEHFMKVFEENGHIHIARYWSDYQGINNDVFPISRHGQSPRADQFAIDLSRPTWTRVNRKYLLPGTLDHFKLPWQWDKVDPDFILIKQYIAPDFQEELFAHTERMKQRQSYFGANDKITHQALPVTGRAHGRTSQSATVEAESSSEIPNIPAQRILKFIDCIHRSYAFPFDRCEKWCDMEKMISQIFHHIEQLSPYVDEGRYDLLDQSGAIILPVFWDDTVKPDMEISMYMWPKPDITASMPAGGQTQDRERRKSTKFVSNPPSERRVHRSSSYPSECSNASPTHVASFTRAKNDDKNAPRTVPTDQPTQSLNMPGVGGDGYHLNTSDDESPGFDLDFETLQSTDAMKSFDFDSVDFDSFLSHDDDKGQIFDDSFFGGLSNDKEAVQADEHETKQTRAKSQQGRDWENNKEFSDARPAFAMERFTQMKQGLKPDLITGQSEPRHGSAMERTRGNEKREGHAFVSLHAKETQRSLEGSRSPRPNQTKPTSKPAPPPPTALYGSAQSREKTSAADPFAPEWLGTSRRAMKEETKNPKVSDEDTLNDVSKSDWQDYQRQMLLLEKQNNLRLLKARREAEHLTKETVVAQMRGFGEEGRATMKVEKELATTGREEGVKTLVSKKTEDDVQQAPTELSFIDHDIPVPDKKIRDVTSETVPETKIRGKAQAVPQPRGAHTPPPNVASPTRPRIHNEHSDSSPTSGCTSDPEGYQRPDRYYSRSDENRRRRRIVESSRSTKDDGFIGATDGELLVLPGMKTVYGNHRVSNYISKVSETRSVAQGVPPSDDATSKTPSLSKPGQYVQTNTSNSAQELWKHQQARPSKGPPPTAAVERMMAETSAQSRAQMGALQPDASEKSSLRRAAELVCAATSQAYELHSSYSAGASASLPPKKPSSPVQSSWPGELRREALVARQRRRRLEDIVTVTGRVGQSLEDEIDAIEGLADSSTFTQAGEADGDGDDGGDDDGEYGPSYQEQDSSGGEIEIPAARRRVWQSILASPAEEESRPAEAEPEKEEESPHMDVVGQCWAAEEEEEVEGARAEVWSGDVRVLLADLTALTEAEIGGALAG